MRWPSSAMAVHGQAVGCFRAPPSRTQVTVSSRCTSASLGFANADPSRTRILPYCHTDQIPLNCPIPGQPSIANTTEAPETGEIVLSFLANASEWMSIGGTPTTDFYLSHDGGVYFGVETAANQYLNDLNQSSVFFGPTELNSGGAADTVFYNEFVPAGTGGFQVASASLNEITYGPVTAPTGYYSTFRAKFSPAISRVTPIFANTPGWVVQSGATVTINGAGFGHQQCSACQVLGSPMGSTVWYPLQVSSWTDQAISALSYLRRCPMSDHTRHDHNLCGVIVIGMGLHQHHGRSGFLNCGRAFKSAVRLHRGRGDSGSADHPGHK